MSLLAVSLSKPSNGGYGVAVAQKLVELLVRVQLPVVTHYNTGWEIKIPLF